MGSAAVGIWPAGEDGIAVCVMIFFGKLPGDECRNQIHYTAAAAIIIKAHSQEVPAALLTVRQIAIIQGVFNTQALSLGELVQCIAFAAVVLPAVEFEKRLIRRGGLYRETAQGQ